jgi:hypothetical protein
MRTGVLPWVWGGTLLALVFTLAVIFVKPIGVSTQFVILDAALWDLVQPQMIAQDPLHPGEYTSPNAYLGKSSGAYAKDAANLANYSFVFVLAMMGGAFLSALWKGERPRTREEKIMPPVWQARFGHSAARRYLICFLAGFLVLYGSRLAGGCTSGHMMSGMMQTALSGYLFALAAFAVAIPLAAFLFNQKA